VRGNNDVGCTLPSQMELWSATVNSSFILLHVKTQHFLYYETLEASSCNIRLHSWQDLFNVLNLQHILWRCQAFRLAGSRLSSNHRWTLACCAPSKPQPTKFYAQFRATVSALLVWPFIYFGAQICPSSPKKDIWSMYVLASLNNEFEY